MNKTLILITMALMAARLRVWLRATTLTQNIYATRCI